PFCFRWQRGGDFKKRVRCPLKAERDWESPRYHFQQAANKPVRGEAEPVYRRARITAVRPCAMTT
ncbi:MAG TPA: hypothetical protein VHY75_08070, partial [Steroidobacteraceae bacterium]|nr:hypothetical protein [Steroidobacteraceae bacterium]